LPAPVHRNAAAQSHSRLRLSSTGRACYPQVMKSPKVQSAPTDAPTTARQLRADSRGKNRLLALLLIGAALIFLGGAVGVVFLARYGGY